MPDRLVFMKNSKLLYILPVLSLLSACGGTGDDPVAAKPVATPEKLYSDARSKIDERHYKDAIKDFEEVERQHPYSPWAMHAQVMSGYASYEIEDYDGAVSTLERFVKLYPNNESTPYAYYLIALCYYEQISDVGRDQKVTGQAMAALRDVVVRFPDTDYARDAKIKLELTQDHLAGKEMQVGRYYLKQNDTLAAINRFRFVIENYQTTSHVPEALHRLVEGYLKLGITAEANRYAAVLGHNFPNSSWYRDSYKLMNGVALKASADEAKKAEKLAESSGGNLGEKPQETPQEKSSWWNSIVPF